MSLRALIEGWLPLLVAAAVAAGGWRLVGPWGAVPGLLLVVAVVGFFRDPPRRPPDDPDAIVAPADGRVVEVEPEADLPAIGGRGRRISIFLSVLDVHVNRAPAAGTIRSSAHSPGTFFDARRAEAAARNERREWVFDSERGTFAVVQIAGLIARRIVAWKAPGDRVAAGEHIGMIRFGSRTDLLLPPSAEVAVRVGDRVRGGETVVARWAGRGP
jgi:phosphatidylserine decarboxylase